MKQMKTLFLALSVAGFVVADPAQAQVTPAVQSHIDNVVKPCFDAAGRISGLSDAQAQSMARTVLPQCAASLRALDTFEKLNVQTLSPSDRNYFYYMGGSVVYEIAGAETIINAGQLNRNICNQVVAAESAWSNVRVPQNSEVHVNMLTHDMRGLLLAPCRRGLQATR